MKRLLAAVLLWVGLALPAHALTFSLPFNDDITILGDLTTPAEVRIQISVFGAFETNNIGVPTGSVAAEVYQRFSGPHADPAVNMLWACRSSGGSVNPCNVFGDVDMSSVVLLITDANRTLRFTSYLYRYNTIAAGGGLTVTLPDGLYVAPLPGTLVLMSSALIGFGAAVRTVRRSAPKSAAA
jgi:hypothetical protein